MLDMARKDKLTIKQLELVSPAARPGMVNGSPQQIADQMEEWFATTAATASTCAGVRCPAVSTISSSWWCRSCGGAACSAANTKAARCARISVCQFRRTGTRR